MAIRNIRISTDEVLRKTCKPIKEIMIIMWVMLVVRNLDMIDTL